MDDILRWIDYPPSDRPSFIAGYLAAPDVVGHLYGPNSKQVSSPMINDTILDQ